MLNKNVLVILNTHILLICIVLFIKQPRFYIEFSDGY